MLVTWRFDVGRFLRFHARLDRRLAAGAGEPLRAWREELAALEADPRRIPFADGLPEPLALRLEPHRIELENLYCPVICELDLTRTFREGIGYEHF